jgi:hypothetical protein
LGPLSRWKLKVFCFVGGWGVGTTPMSHDAKDEKADLRWLVASSTAPASSTPLSWRPSPDEHHQSSLSNHRRTCRLTWDKRDKKTPLTLSLLSTFWLSLAMAPKTCPVGLGLLPLSPFRHVLLGGTVAMGTPSCGPRIVSTANEIQGHRVEMNKGSSFQFVSTHQTLIKSGLDPLSCENLTC